MKHLLLYMVRDDGNIELRHVPLDGPLDDEADHAAVEAAAVDIAFHLGIHLVFVFSQAPNMRVAQRLVAEHKRGLSSLPGYERLYVNHDALDESERPEER